MHIILWLAALQCVQLAHAQEIEPRRWSHLPVGANFLGVGYVYSDTDIEFTPATQIEDATGEIHTFVTSYTRALDVFGKSGRIEVVLPYSSGRWEGLLEGEPASTRRRGLNDPKFRFAVNLLGSPAQRGEEFRRYKVGTIVGAAIEVYAPFGEYKDDKLINLGNNRWTIRPQLGVMHSWDRWTAELTGSAWLYTDNDDFDGDKTLEKDPVYSIQGHLIYNFAPGIWASASSAYGGGGQQSIDGSEVGDGIGRFLWAFSAGYSFNPKQGVKLTFLRDETTKDTGADSNRVLVAYSMMWGG